MTYILTFNCYGTRVPGDERGWYERSRGSHRGGYKEPDPGLDRYARKIMLQEAYQLDVARARIVLDAICEVCQCRSWNLVAAHVRTTHIHVVVGSLCDPDRAISDFKSYSSRALNRHGFGTADRHAMGARRQHAAIGDYRSGTRRYPICSRRPGRSYGGSPMHTHSPKRQRGGKASTISVHISSSTLINSCPDSMIRKVTCGWRTANSSEYSTGTTSSCRPWKINAG
jgi:hypothetical protein